MRKKAIFKNYEFQDTRDPDLKRVVDVNGNWTTYYNVKKKRYYRAVNHIISLGYNKGPRFAEYLLRTRYEEAKENLENAGNRGTRSHNAIQDLAYGRRIDSDTLFYSDLTQKKEPLSPEEWQNIEGFANFCEMYQPEIIEVERPVSSDVYGFAGTFDMICTILVPDKDRKFPQSVWGKRVLVLPLDYKTSSDLWAEYGLQISAYYTAIKEKKIAREFVEFYKGKLFGLLVRIGTKHKDRFEIKAYTELELNTIFRKKFLSAMQIAEDHEPQVEPKIEDVRRQFHIKLKMAKLPKLTPKPAAKPVKETKKMKS